MKKAWYSSILLAIIVCLVGCGGAGKGPWQKGPMPASGDFDGVYQSDFGRLELTVSGNDVVGLFEDDQHYGRIEGKLNGNLLVFSWTQWSEKMQGKVQESSGEGVFQYIVEQVPTTNKTKEYHRLDGWYGYDDGAKTNRWNAAKMSSRVKKRLTQRSPASSEGDADYEPTVGFDANQTEPQAEQQTEPEPEDRAVPAVEPKSTGDDDLC